MEISTLSPELKKQYNDAKGRFLKHGSLTVNGRHAYVCHQQVSAKTEKITVQYYTIGTPVGHVSKRPDGVFTLLENLAVPVAVTETVTFVEPLAAEVITDDPKADFVAFAGELAQIWKEAVEEGLGDDETRNVFKGPFIDAYPDLSTDKVEKSLDLVAYLATGQKDPEHIKHLVSTCLANVTITIIPQPVAPQPVTAIEQPKQVLALPEPVAPQPVAEVTPDASFNPFNLFGDRKRTNADIVGMAFERHYTACERAFHNVSFDPEKRAKYYIAHYSTLLKDDLVTIESYATTDEARARLDDIKAKYSTKFEAMFLSWVAAKSRCISSMITGPANFPVARAEKANNAEHKRTEEIHAWREKALRFIKKNFTPKPENTINAGPVENDLAEVTQKLEDRKKRHELMKEANRIIREGQDVKAGLSALGLSPKQIQNLLTPDFDGQTGYRSYELANNNKEIHRLEGRVKELTGKLEAAKGKDGKEIPFEGGLVRLDYSDDRVRIIYNERPEKELITKLKSNGFKWSPSNSAWQRQLTANALYTTSYLVGVNF